MKPSDRPSGDQKGCAASSVPGTTRASSESSARIHIMDRPPTSVDTNATRRPSGETAAESCGVIRPDAEIDNRVAGPVSGDGVRYLSATAPPATMAAAAAT